MLFEWGDGDVTEVSYIVYNGHGPKVGVIVPEPDPEAKKRTHERIQQICQIWYNRQIASSGK